MLAGATRPTRPTRKTGVLHERAPVRAGRSARPRVGCEQPRVSYPLLLRQVFMNALRSSPFLSPAWTLHAFIFSCCVIGAEAAIADEADRQFFMNALRSSPFLSPACLLHIVILFCWLFSANAGAASRPPSTSAAIADWIFMGHSIGYRLFVVIRRYAARRKAVRPVDYTIV